MRGGVWVWGCGFRVKGTWSRARFRLQDLGLGVTVPGSGFHSGGLGYRVHSLGQGFGSGVHRLGLGLEATVRQSSEQHPILCENLFNLKTNFKAILATLERNNLIILSKVAKIALEFIFRLKRFSHKIAFCSFMTCTGARRNPAACGTNQDTRKND